MSYPRLPFITLCLVLGVGLMAGACAAPLAVSGAGYAADGGLLVASDKTSTDHMDQAAGDIIVIVRFAGKPVGLHVESFGFSGLQFSTNGAAHGHNGGANTQSIAAAYWNSGRGGLHFFNSNAVIETFSSDGPRRTFFNPDGSPITPGNFKFATGGGTVLQKPDFTGADGVTTRTPGFNPFYGTSAAAPHAHTASGD